MNAEKKENKTAMQIKHTQTTIYTMSKKEVYSLIREHVEKSNGIRLPKNQTIRVYEFALHPENTPCCTITVKGDKTP